MKTNAFVILVFAIAIALFHVSCNSPAVKTIATPAVKAQVIGDIEKDLLAAGGALLISGGNSGAAVAALTQQEVKNIPELQKALQTATPATVSGAVEAPALPAVVVTPSGK